MTEKDNFLKAVARMVFPYWQSKEKWIAYLLLGCVIVLNLGQVFLQILFNKWYNTFYTALQHLNQKAFWGSIVYFCVLATCFIVVAVYSMYLTQMLTVRWRRWLTAHMLRSWLGQQGYYHMQFLSGKTDNPDQRISEDVRQFIELTLALSLGVLSALATLMSFVLILWHLSGPLDFHIHTIAVHVPGYMVWAALLYALLGTWCTHLIGRPLIALNFNQQRFEADFRFSMARFRENSETVAFYSGEAAEKKNFLARFSHVFQNYWQIMKRQKRLTWFTAFYAQTAVIFPFVVSCPRLFAKQIQLGDVMQIADTFGRVQAALSYLINAYTDIATWKATCDRLISFQNKLKQAKSIPACLKVDHNRAHIQAKDLELYLPAGNRIVRPVTFRLSKGDSLLIMGPSGCGKTTLLRTLAGLWPFTKGYLALPKKSCTFFIPQKPYIPLGTLKEALCYPNPEVHITASCIYEALVLCKLTHLCDRINERIDWTCVLSVGELQRISFVRALLFSPDFLLLDEATSGLDVQTESHLYALLKKNKPTTCLVSVGHRDSLKTWHEKVLVLQPEIYDATN